MKLHIAMGDLIGFLCVGSAGCLGGVSSGGGGDKSLVRNALVREVVTVAPITVDRLVIVALSLPSLFCQLWILRSCCTVNRQL